MREPNRAAVLGAGREGRAASAYLKRRWPECQLTVFDDGAEHPSAPTDPADWVEFDLIVKSPGWPPHHPAVQAARRAGLALTTGTQLWFDQATNWQTIVVTGTKGKSTTTGAIGHVLEGVGKNVTVAGNIGRPLLDVPVRGEGGICVIELSSYQMRELDFGCDVWRSLEPLP